jgi:hypothetical protein
MSLRTSFLVLGGVFTAISAVHCSSSDSGSSHPPCALDGADPTLIHRLTPEQQNLVTQASDRTKAALSAAEWRYLFKLRYAFFPRAAVETDPVVVKALAAIAPGTPSCKTASSIDACDRFANVGRCWSISPINATTVSCFTWAMMVASSAGCPVPTSPAAAHVDAEAWDDAQDGHETADCEAPCIAGGGCAHGTCKCAADESPCPGGCGRTKSDVANCGHCGVVCAAGVACVEGVCGGATETDAGSDAASDSGSMPDAH